MVSLLWIAAAHAADTVAQTAGAAASAAGAAASAGLGAGIGAGVSALLRRKAISLAACMMALTPISVRLDGSLATVRLTIVARPGHPLPATCAGVRAAVASVCERLLTRGHHLIDGHSHRPMH